MIRARNPWWIVAACVLGLLCSGRPRYFGLRSYGMILAALFGIFAGSTGMGPFLSGRSFDLFHSDVPAFRFYEVILVVAIAIFLPLGLYPYPARRRAAPAPRGGQVPA